VRYVKSSSTVVLMKCMYHVVLISCYVRVIEWCVKRTVLVEQDVSNGIVVRCSRTHTSYAGDSFHRLVQAAV
jgi:hypothetical protein